MGEPKKKMFESKKSFERRQRTEAKLDGYVEQGLKRVSGKRQTYTVECGHCHRKGVMSNGKPCRNCGGSGKITRG